MALFVTKLAWLFRKKDQKLCESLPHLQLQPHIEVVQPCLQAAELTASLSVDVAMESGGHISGLVLLEQEDKNQIIYGIKAFHLHFFEKTINLLLFFLHAKC